MKKIYVLVFALIVSLICACQNKAVLTNEKNDNKVKIMTTIFPIYDLTKELTKDIDSVDITLLMDTGIDLHNFSPSSKDLVNISNSDMFIYIGGESDKWVDEAFDTLKIDKNKQLNLMSLLDENLKEEELKEGMEDTEEEGEESEEDKKEYDEHIWLSLRNAKLMIKNIKGMLEKKISDTASIEKLNKNYETLSNELTVLDEEYKKLIDDARNSGKTMTMIFTDRFPFRYFVDDYDIDYFAAFKGCSAESEASFKTVVFLAEKLKELNLKYVFVLDDSDKKIANTVIETAGKNDIEILALDSMQSKTAKDVENGVRYIDLMNNNYNVIKNYFN